LGREKREFMVFVDTSKWVGHFYDGVLLDWVERVAFAEVASYLNLFA
jgi:hypothetical protein